MNNSLKKCIQADEAWSFRNLKALFQIVTRMYDSNITHGIILQLHLVSVLPWVDLGQVNPLA